jgi:hypothetical protein
MERVATGHGVRYSKALELHLTGPSIIAEAKQRITETVKVQVSAQKSCLGIQSREWTGQRGWRPVSSASLHPEFYWNGAG